MLEIARENPKYQHKAAPPRSILRGMMSIMDGQVLVVTTNPEVIDMLSRILDGFWDLRLNALQPARIVDYVQQAQPNLILFDSVAPIADRYLLCEELKKLDCTKHIPILFITTQENITQQNKICGFKAGCSGYIPKPFSAEEVRAKINTHLALQSQNIKLRKQLRAAHIETLSRLSRAAEYRDNETGNHLHRIGYFCARIARVLGQNEEQIELIFHASRMHDIGKIAIPDEILYKEDELTENEWSIMRRHCRIGSTLLQDGESKLISLAHDIALTHHERWDGQGYPDGLKGSEIPLAGRITSVCDVYDALTSQRPYKDAWEHEKAVEAIKDGAGSQFDPEIVTAFLRAKNDFADIADRFSEDCCPSAKHLV